MSVSTTWALASCGIMLRRLRTTTRYRSYGPILRSCALPLINERCSLDPSSYALLNTRFLEMRDETKAFLLQASENSAIDEQLRALGRVAEFRTYLQECAQVDGNLDKLIRGYAHDIASRPGTAAVDSSTRTTVVGEEGTSSPSPKPPIKREELASSTPLVTTATKIEEPPLPSSEPAIKQIEPSAQNPLATLFAERAAREEARQKRMRVAERAEIRAKAKARQEAIAKDPTTAEQRRQAEEMKAKLEKEAVAKQNVLASIDADKALRREKAEMTRLRRLQELETQKEEEKAKQEEMVAKEAKKKEEASIEAHNKSRREEAGMTRLARLQELERRSEEENAKKMKEKEMAAKLSALDGDMEFDDKGIEETDDEKEADVQQEEGDEKEE